MSFLLRLALASAWNRRGTLGLVLASIALSTALLWTLEGMRRDLRSSFSQAVSGTDLVIGARGGSVQLMLHAVFRVGGATNGISMDSVRAVSAHRAVAWTVPIALGDSYRGFPVLGTTTGYFQHFAYGDRQALAMASGRVFSGQLDGLYEAVLGAEVARQLGHRLGDRITLSHGMGTTPGLEHADKAFSVIGILQPTGTPVDRTVHVSLQALQAIHLDWVGGAPMPGLRISAEDARKFDLEPRQVTAALVGLKSRAAVFMVQRYVSEYREEPLMAVLPGVALDELWQALGLGERALQLVCALVALVSLAGLVATVLAGLNERRRELAVLRAMGAGPRDVMGLLVLEGAVVTSAGVVVGVMAALGAQALAAPLLQAHFGIQLQWGAPAATQWGVLAGVLSAGMLASLLPAWRAYRLSLADGLSPRL